MPSDAQVREWAARDVERVRKYARTVIQMLRGGQIECIENANPLLEVVAVIGPGTNREMRVDEAVLCEVGLHRTRPYRRSERRSKATGQGRPRPYLSLIPARRRDFVLSPQQYSLVAPTLFSVLIQRTLKVVGQWREPTFTFLTDRLYVNRRKKLVGATRFRSYVRGCRISVSRNDTLLCADLLRAEYDDPFWSQQMVGLATTLLLALKPLESGYRRPFLALPEVKRVREYLESRLTASLPNYILEELPQYLNQRKGTWPKKFRTSQTYPLLAEVSELTALVTGVDTDHPSWQRQLMERAIPGFSQRVEGLWVRDISVLRPADKSKSNLVFEVLPQKRDGKT